MNVAVNQGWSSWVLDDFRQDKQDLHTHEYLSRFK